MFYAAKNTFATRGVRTQIVKVENKLIDVLITAEKCSESSSKL